MLIISRETVESVMATRQKMANPAKKAECIADIEKMIEIKESHLWRAEWPSCCTNICGLATQIESELGMLQDTLNAMKEGDDGKAASLLEDYLNFMEKNYELEHPNY